jgi:hypothetical protein
MHLVAVTSRCARVSNINLVLTTTLCVRCLSLLCLVAHCVRVSLCSQARSAPGRFTSWHCLRRTRQANYSASCYSSRLRYAVHDVGWVRRVAADMV